MATFRTAEKIVFGAGTLRQLPAEVARLGGRRILVVTDPGVAKAGLLSLVTAQLELAQVSFHVFDEVEADPSMETASKAMQAAISGDYNLVIGVGGGSALDIAKIAAVMVNNDGPLSDFVGVDRIPNPGLPVIAIPTTAGTGSEVTGIVVLTDVTAEIKTGIVSPLMLPRCALVDPELTLTVPQAVTAATGMDALVHAVEAYVSVNANVLSDALALKAVGLIAGNLRRAWANGDDLSARIAMSEGSTLAGMAFSSAGVGAVHACAYPLGARYQLPHGVSNSLMFEPVMRFNMVGCLPQLRDIGEALGLRLEHLPDRDAGLAVIEAIRALAFDIGIPGNLREVGVTDDALEDMAAGVVSNTRLLQNNPRRVSLEDALHIYQMAMG